jgi:hypothetical protein
MTSAPYAGLSVEQWEQRTRELIAEHPLSSNEIHEVVNSVWTDIFQSKIGSKPFQIGIDIFPSPQIMGYLLHELVPLEFAHRYPVQWRRDQTATEADLVYIPDQSYSIEMKTSSHRRSIFGNRSYTQETSTTKKTKTGYYLAINFGKFGVAAQPSIAQIRFGWLDHSDWIGQSASSGQQARLTPEADKYKLLKLPLDG